MAVHVLVTYVSPHGSTQGIAERIATRLRESAVSVDCLPIHETQAVADYDAVVVGSAIHDQAWLPEASQFLATHAAELLVRPVWLFSVGMPGALARPLRRLAMREGPKVVAPFTMMVRPRGTRLFTGVVSKQHFPRVGKAVLMLMGGHFGDLRSWPDIDAWATEISGSLLEGTSSAGRCGPSDSGTGGGAGEASKAERTW
jgi:menaquinone-dependent protoporphyrinogen oxidase